MDSVTDNCLANWQRQDITALEPGAHGILGAAPAGRAPRAPRLGHTRREETRGAEDPDLQLAGKGGRSEHVRPGPGLGPLRSMAFPHSHRKQIRQWEGPLPGPAMSHFFHQPLSPPPSKSALSLCGCSAEGEQRLHRADLEPGAKGGASVLLRGQARIGS